MAAFAGLSRLPAALPGGANANRAASSKARPQPLRCLARQSAPGSAVWRSVPAKSTDVLRRAAGSGWQQRAAARQPPTVTRAAQRGQVELLLDAVPGKGELLSPKLDPEVRQRAERAITQRGGRVTIGDVAGSAGLKLDQAEEAMRALAADSLATLQVSEQGEIVYVFPAGFQDTIRNKSLLLRMEPVLAGIKSGARYAARVAFGTALIASVIAVFTAITVISSSSNSKDDNRQRGGGGGGIRLFFDPTDLLYFWDPWYYRNRRQRMVAMGQQQQQQGMNFLEAIFSWVFGDGDPNADYDKQRWQAAGRYIQGRGGVVLAEEMAPFLDLQPGQLASDRNRLTVDESYMLPVLARFNGTPEVDSGGNIVYTFPDLQQTAKAARRQAPPRAVALENRWQLTAASAGQKLGAVALGALNFFGVAALTFMVRDPVNQMALARNGLLWVSAAMPFLQAYALTFFAIPLFRSIQNTAANARIDARNAARQAALALLQRPDPVLQRKMAGAEALAQQNVIGERDVIYRSDKALEQQPTDIQVGMWNARMARRELERQQAGQAPPPHQQQEQELPPQWWQDQQAQKQQQKDRR